MKQRALLALLVAVAVSTAAGVARAESKERVLGGFEIAGYLSAGFGWQRFSDAPITNNQGSAFGGPMGQLIPNAQTGVAPNPGEDFVQGFLQRMELDVIKDLGKRTKVRADLYFGRANSGSSVAGFALEHAYCAVRLGKDYNWEIQLGRVGLVTGYESYEYYSNDTISLSILSTGSLYPGPITGALITGDVTDNVKVYFGIGNNLDFDTNAGNAWVPGGLAIFELDWGPEGKGNYTALTLNLNPTTFSNDSLSFGANLDLGWYFTDKWQIALEGLYKGFRGGGGPEGNFAAGLLRFHWDITDRWATYLKYAYGRQFENIAGAYNLTGAEQQIHQASTGFVHMVADTVKWKIEARVDTTLPAGGRREFVYGVATSLDCAF